MYEKYRRKCKGHMKYSEKVEYTCLLKGREKRWKGARATFE